VQRLQDRERLVALVRASLQGPTSEYTDTDGLLLVSEAVPEVGVRFSDQGVSVFVYRRKWHGVSELVADHYRLASLGWEELPEQADEAYTLVAPLIEASRQQRASAYRVCRHCGRNTPLEYLHDEHLCMSCAPGLLGVVY
jgi:hypothetical protein